MPFKLRFTIGQVMGLIALTALLMANANFVTKGNFQFTCWSVAIECAVLVVLIYNHRLSAWLWVSIVGQGGQLLWLVMATLMGVLLPTPVYSHAIIVVIQITVGLLSLLLFALGVAMTFRDIRRRLAIYENVP